MANISDCCVHFTGNNKAIIDAHNYINKYILKDWLLAHKCYKDIYKKDIQARDIHALSRWAEGDVIQIQIQCSEDFNPYLDIAISGRWCGPSGFFIHVAEKFKLEMNYTDLEGGCNFFHHVQTDDTGEVILNEEYDYLSKESLSELGLDQFQDEIDDMENGEDSYLREDKKELLQSYLKKEKVTVKNYTEKALRTWTGKNQLERAQLGIKGEFGEVCEVQKKYLRGDFDIEERNKRIVKEIGDVLYYEAVKLYLEKGSFPHRVTVEGTHLKSMSKDITTILSKSKEYGELKTVLGILRSLDIYVGACLQQNIEKLTDRAKRNVINGSGDNR